MKTINEKAEEYADKVELDKNTYRGDVVTAYVCGANDFIKDKLKNGDNVFMNHFPETMYRFIGVDPENNKECFVSHINNNRGVRGVVKCLITELILANSQPLYKTTTKNPLLRKLLDKDLGIR